MLKYYFPKYVYKKIYVPKIHTVHEPHKLVHTNVKGYFNTEYIDIITLHNIWCSEYLVPTYSLVRSVMLLCIYEYPIQYRVFEPCSCTFICIQVIKSTALIHTCTSCRYMYMYVRSPIVSYTCTACVPVHSLHQTLR